MPGKNKGTLFCGEKVTSLVFSILFEQKCLLYEGISGTKTKTSWQLSSAKIHKYWIFLCGKTRSELEFFEWLVLHDTCWTASYHWELGDDNFFKKPHFAEITLCKGRSKDFFMSRIQLDYCLRKTEIHKRDNCAEFDAVAFPICSKHPEKSSIKTNHPGL